VSEAHAEDTSGGFRLFTVDEANDLLPVIAPILLKVQGVKRQLDAARSELDQLTPAMRANGYGAEAAALDRRVAEAIVELTAAVQEIAALGIEVKDLDLGLVDFPAPRDGRVVFLCWRLGEERVLFWHELDAGFAGRQPI
jgi:hypothetical protein